jgi:predicted outer membrane repeat protein
MTGRFYLLLLLVLLALPLSLSARTWYIEPGGTGDAPTIQAGLDSASAGDTVLVECGTYYEHDILMKSGVTLTSTGGIPSCVTIDAEQQGRVVRCNGVNYNTRIEGFTLTGGLVGAGDGGGIYCYGGSYPIFANLIVTDNEAGGSGGGMCCFYSSARLSNVTFSLNSAGWGGGLYFEREGGGAMWLTDVTFSENSAGSGGGFEFSDVDTIVVTNASFTRNHADEYGGAMSAWGIFTDDRYFRVANTSFMQNSCAELGGAVFTYDSDAIFEYCTFSGNSAGVAGGAAFAFWGYSPALNSCTFFGNSSPNGACLAVDTSWFIVTGSILSYGLGGSAVAWDGSYTFTCCDIYGNEGGDWVYVEDQLGIRGNIQVCPAFCNAVAEPYDFHLCDESPCAPGNHPDGYDCGLIGAWDVGCSCGPSGTQPSTWGSIKAMYK